MKAESFLAIRFGIKSPLSSRARSLAEARGSGPVTAGCVGLAMLLAGLAAIQAQTFSVVRTFPVANLPGWYGRLVCDGNCLYGLDTGSHGQGAVFRINTDGTGYTALKSFPSTTSNGSGAYTNS